MQEFKRLIKISGLIAGFCFKLAMITAQPLPLPTAYANNVTVNYVRTWSATAPEQDPNNLITRPLKDVKQVTQYIDGLGRPLQTVARQGSLVSGGSPTDMISPVVYDEFGREVRKYLPFASAATDGGFKLNPFQQQAAFYNTQLAGQAGETNLGSENSNWAYTKTNYEPSPLNRVLSAYAPGVGWTGSEAAVNAADKHGVQMNYWANTPNDDVKMWSVTDVTGGWGTYGMSGTYPAGELYKTVTVDEKGSQLIEFKDKTGQVILKKVQLKAAPDDGSGTGYADWLCTYYIYDELGRLRCVIQPRGVELLLQYNWDITGSNNDILNEQCFRYEYDGRNRMIMKKVPGAGEAYMVYDARDRLVMTQDANMRANQQWLYTQYDGINRPISTGLLTDPANNNLAYHLAQAYGSSTYPNLANYTTVVELTHSYYDDYTAIASIAGAAYNAKDNGYDTYFANASNSSWPYPQPLTQSSATRDLVTGTKTRVLNFPGDKYLYTASFYDDKGRTIQTKSSNISDGFDITTTQYSFSGQPLMIVQKQEQAGSPAQTSLVLSQITYDDLGRTIKTEKKLGNSLLNGGGLPSAWTTTAENQYDALGQLKTKKLGRQKDVTGNYTSMPVEALAYDYNIRGWLLGMNRDYLTTEGQTYDGIHFGFELGYDKTVNKAGQAFNNSQFNGNINGMLWKSDGDDIRRKYDYVYDAANRLLRADFIQQNGDDHAWNNFKVNFGVKMGDGNDVAQAYDANGNILRMQQWGLKISGSQQIDDLKYTYYNGGNSNRLKNVQDLLNDPLTTLGDFRTSTLHPQSTAKQAAATQADRDLITDYTYDANGSMIRDYNKDIGDAATDGIHYNYLNLPEAITVKNKGTINYVYDASGNKWQKIVQENNASVSYNGAPHSTGITTTITYINGGVYESKAYSNNALANLQYTNKLQFLGQEEGRIRALYKDPNNLNTLTDFAYDYFIKDHLGNIRMVLTEEQQVDKYPIASLEPSRIAKEQTYYNIDNVHVVPNPSGIPTYQNNSNGIGNNPPDAAFEGANSAFVYQLNGNSNKTGLGITLKVMAGDRIDIFGTSYYSQSNTGGPPVNVAPAVIDILTGLIGAPTGAAAGAHTTAIDLNGVPLVNNAVGSFIGDGNRDDANYLQRPKAFINYVFLDEQFHYAGGGFSAVNSTPGIKTHYSDLQNKLVPKNGYVYIYCSNESPVDVFFDNLQVVHTRGPILEETHYYPFGLTMLGISSNANKGTDYAVNQKKYQGQEFTADLNADYYEFRWRFDDPQIGRFIQIDPLSHKYVYNSTYAFSENKVTSHIELEGLETIFFGEFPFFANNSTTITRAPVVETLTKPAAETATKLAETTGKTNEHHLIPKQVKNDPVVEAARDGGFKFEGKENKIPVEQFNKASGEGTHGNHPNYNSEIAERLAQFQKANPEASPQQAAEFIRAVAQEMRQTITNNPGTKINDLFKPGGSNLNTITPLIPAKDGTLQGLPRIGPLPEAHPKPKPIDPKYAS